MLDVSVFSALSIGGSLMAAVDLCMKRDVYNEKAKFISTDAIVPINKD